MAESIDRAIVVGASSGIGEAIVRRIVARGGSVVALARRSDLLASLASELNDTTGRQAVIPIVHDVTNREEIPGLFQESCRLLGGLDTIVYSSGVLRSVNEQEYDTSASVTMIEINLVGGIAWCDAAAERFSVLGAGRIVGIASIAGDRGRRGNPGYATSKGGFSIYLESLRNRLEQLGVSVTTIKPGLIETAMTEDLPSKPMIVSADRAGELIVRAVERRRNTVYVPERWRIVSWILRSLPSFIFRRLSF